jgi:hypothetical protein
MERLQRFQKTEALIRVIDDAYGCGIRAFTFSTHDRVSDICDHLRANPTRFNDLRLYPVLPYAQKYAHLVNEKGVVGAVSEVLLADNSVSSAFGMIVRSSMAFLTQDPIKVMTLLVDAELKMFRGLQLGAVFLQNNVADLMLGLGIKEVFLAYIRHIESKYHTRAGFMTLNLPRMLTFLQDAGVDCPVVCSAINKVGFQMNPGVAEYESTLKSSRADVLAMSAMAAGALSPREAMEYVARLPGVGSIMFGASTRAHVEQTQQVLKEVGWC